MEVNKSIFKRQADFLEKNGKYILQFTCKLWYNKSKNTERIISKQSKEDCKNKSIEKNKWRSIKYEKNNFYDCNNNVS